MLLVAGLLAFLAAKALRDGKAGWFLSSVRRSDNPELFRTAILTDVVLVALLVVIVIVWAIFPG